MHLIVLYTYKLDTRRESHASARVLQRHTRNLYHYRLNIVSLRIYRHEKGGRTKPRKCRSSRRESPVVQKCDAAARGKRPSESTSFRFISRIISIKESFSRKADMDFATFIARYFILPFLSLSFSGFKNISSLMHRNCVLIYIAITRSVSPERIKKGFCDEYLFSTLIYTHHVDEVWKIITNKSVNFITRRKKKFDTIIRTDCASMDTISYTN